MHGKHNRIKSVCFKDVKEIKKILGSPGDINVSELITRKILIWNVEKYQAKMA